ISTGIRVPRMTGFPAITEGLISIRSCIVRGASQDTRAYSRKNDSMIFRRGSLKPASRTYLRRPHRQHRAVVAGDAYPSARGQVGADHAPIGVVDADLALAIDDRLGENKTLADQPRGAFVEERLLAPGGLAGEVVAAD